MRGPRGRLPLIHQAEAAECGLACLVMIANYYGHNLDLNAVRQSHSVSLKGATLESVMAVSERFDLSPRALRLELEDLEKLQLPAILHWNMNHFVVLKSIKKGRAILHDPARGRRVMALSALSDHFTGIALELSPKSDFKATEHRLKTHLGQLWTRLIGLKRALFQTLVLSLILQAAVLAAPFYLQFVVDGVIGKGLEGLLPALALGFGGLILIRVAAETARNWAILIYGNQMSVQMTGNVFAHLIRLPVAYFEKRHVGDIISRINSTQPIQTALTQTVVAGMIDGLMAIFTLIVMFIFSPILAFIVLISVAILLAVTLWLYPKIRVSQEEAIVARAEENSLVIESIRAATTVKLFGREAARESAWRNLFTHYINANTRYGGWIIGQRSLQTLITGLQLIILVYIGAKAVMSGDLSLGMLFAFLSFAQSFTLSASALVQKSVDFRLLGLHLERLSDIIYAPQEDRNIDGQTFGLKDIQGQLSLKAVSFRYGPDDPLILDRFSLEVKSGELLAITGKSGGGKTTLLKLILGLYTPESGEILIDGRPLEQIDLALLRQKIGVVMQDDALLSGNLSENISVFDADLDMDRVMDAAKSARIHDEIMAMPMQYRSHIGDMGSILSGGQRQRILLARALYHRPKLLFLDEGTANLDVLTEKEIADVISALPITRIIIAHRPEFLARADRIIEIKSNKRV